MTVRIRQALPRDVRSIRALVEPHVPTGRLLRKNMVTLFEDVQEFLVAELDGQVVGCGALHVLWEDLAEVRTLAVAQDFKKRGIGSELLEALLERARQLEIERVFCLTFETKFFGEHGFVEIDGTPVEHDVFVELIASYDDGVAEFLDLEWVKPNTLGNSRMLRYL